MLQSTSPSGKSNSLCIEQWPLNKLKPTTNRVRRQSKATLAKIKSSLQRFKFVRPVLATSDGEIIDGHALLEAARELNFDAVPVIIVDHLTKAEIKALRIALNRLGELGEWDNDALKLEFEAIEALDLDFDLSLTSFETAQIDFIMESGSNEAAVAACPQDDELPETATATVVSVKGDVWLIGAHKIICGDARDQDVMERLMGLQKAKMVFTDPPYNVRIQGHVSGSGNIKHREFAMASGEMTEKEFESFLKQSLGRLVEVTMEGGLIYVCMDWRHVETLLRVGRQIGQELLNLIVFNKNNGGLGSLYRSKHELICLFKKPGAPHTNNVQLGKYHRNRTNVWSYAGVNSFGSNRMEELASHPTVKPVAMVADAIRDVTKRGDIVLDSFAGSGTTMIAAERTGRVARCIEYDPIYVDVAIRRFQGRFDVEAVHEETGMTFSELAAVRAAEGANEPPQRGEGDNTASTSDRDTIPTPRPRVRHRRPSSDQVKPAA